MIWDHSCPAWACCWESQLKLGSMQQLVLSFQFQKLTMLHSLHVQEKESWTQWSQSIPTFLHPSELPVGQVKGHACDVTLSRHPGEPFQLPPTPSPRISDLSNHDPERATEVTFKDSVFAQPHVGTHTHKQWFCHPSPVCVSHSVSLWMSAQTILIFHSSQAKSYKRRRERRENNC